MSDSPSFELKKDPTGFLRVTPTPDETVLRQLYSHEYYVRDKPVYLEKTAKEIDYWRSIWRIRLHGLQGDSAPGSILDVGASGGFFLDVARSDGWQVVGVEPSLQSAAYAREHLDLDLFEGYLEDFDGGPFDAIHMALVLEHVRDPRAFLKHTLNLLRPGGMIWVEVPNDFNRLQNAIVDKLGKSQWWVVPEHHLNYFDYNSLSALLGELGAQEINRTASFPMELFVLMGLDYIGDDKIGSQAHGYRMNLEKNILNHDPETLKRLYDGLAQADMGRTCNILAQKAL